MQLAILTKALRGELVEHLPIDGDKRELLKEIKKLKGKKLIREEELDMATEPEKGYGK